MKKTLYDLLGLKGNSILKSVFISGVSGDSHANVKLDVEAYDKTYENAIDKKGLDYVVEQINKELRKKGTQEKLANHIGERSYEGSLVTVHGENFEYYFK